MLIQVPTGSEAVLKAPVAPSPDLNIVEGTQVIWQNGAQKRHHPGIRSIEIDDDRVKICTNSGRYRFVFNTDPLKLQAMNYNP